MIETFGASVIGPAHSSRNAPNEDAWGHGRVGAGGVVVVSDGMGTRSHARRGARAACAATVRACRSDPTIALNANLLLAALHAEWRRVIAPETATDCACTCLLAVVNEDGCGLVAQLGDGLALVRRQGQVVTHGERGSGAFANETAALEAEHRPDAWRVTSLEPGTDAVVLCTDGVGDDLLPERLGAFADWVIDEVGDLGPVPRRHALRDALFDWPTPKHLDDKTIAALVVRGDRDA